MTNWDAEATRLLELARHGHDPTERDRSRIAAAFAARCLAEPGLLVGKAASGFTLKATLGKGLASTKLASFKLVALPLWAAFGVGAAAGAVTGTAAFYGSRTATSVEARPAPERVTNAAGTRAHGAQHETRSGITAASDRAEPSGAERSVSEEVRSSAAESLARNALAVVRAPPPALPTVPRSAPASPAGSASAVGLPALASSAIFAPSEPVASPNPLALEVSTLRRAQQFLHAGDGAQALSILNGLEREHTVVALREEWQATRAMALCTLGRGSSALAADFARRFPGSVHLEPVRGACEARGNSSSYSTDRTGSRH